MDNSPINHFPRIKSKRGKNRKFRAFFMTLNYNDKCRKPDRISESFDIISAGILVLIEKK